ncbi:MAG: rhodanese-like domain-containing protein [Geitlerinemataceae cyanobacterium]
MIDSIAPDELAQVLADDTIPVQLIDVRERQEVEIAALPQFWVLPLSESGEWVDRLLEKFDPNCKTIVMCHHGIRSLHLCQWLEAQGFTDLYNVSGGIDAYAVRVDRSLPRY